jgi:hypothetical protein
MEQLTTFSANKLIALLCNYLIKGEKFKAIQLLRDLKNKNNNKNNIDIDITYLIDQILPFGDIVFYRYVKSENKDMINSFHSFDKILHTNDTNLILNLLKFDIIEPHYSAVVNNTTITTVVYMIIQLSEYDVEVKDYLFQKYSQGDSQEDSHNISEEGLLRHMLLENVCNDIFVYIKACLENKMISVNILNFDRILESYQAMYDKYKDNAKDNKRLRSRLIGITQLISKYCLDKLLMLPTYEDYKTKFESQDIIKKYTKDQSDQTNQSDQSDQTDQTELKQIINKICYDSYEYINFRVPWGSQR